MMSLKMLLNYHSSRLQPYLIVYDSQPSKSLGSAALVPMYYPEGTKARVSAV